MTRRTLDDIIAHADELADKFENYDPAPGDDARELSPDTEVPLTVWRQRASR